MTRLGWPAGAGLALLLGAATLDGALESPAAQEPAHEHPAGEAEKLGRVDFAVSCSPAAQERFGRAVALLHSFWYGQAEKAFAEVTRIDPTCAMAGWGVAMSLFHPIWAAANPAGAPSPAEMERGRAAAAEAAGMGGKTSRERDYIAAVAAFYAVPGTGDYPARAAAFENAMEEVHRRNPEDREAGIFYALALLGNAPPTDQSYARQKRAAEILNRLLPEAPEHPGIAHYLIHSFDYPSLAALALPAARAYSKLAASSPHALHMPSHIFTRLGLWEDSIQSNLASAESAKSHVQATQGPDYASFDQLHALDYLEYAYLQEARDGEARRTLDEMASVDKLDAPNFAAAYALAAVPARYALERRQWKQAGALTVRPAGFPWAKFSFAEALTHFARAIGGARGGDVATAKDALARLVEMHRGRVEAKDVSGASQIEIQKLAAGAWIAQSEGRSDEAVKGMRAAADLEDSTDKHPVTPGPVLPARELLGDLLLEQGRAAEALKEYQASLLTAPGRFNSLAGAVRAAETAGEGGKARELYAKLEALCARSDGSRPELAGLRARYAKKGSS